jgi:hypothetical protein
MTPPIAPAMAREGKRRPSRAGKVAPPAPAPASATTTSSGTAFESFPEFAETTGESETTTQCPTVRETTHPHQHDPPSPKPQAWALSPPDSPPPAEYPPSCSPRTYPALVIIMGRPPSPPRLAAKHDSDRRYDQHVLPRQSWPLAQGALGPLPPRQLRPHFRSSGGAIPRRAPGHAGVPPHRARDGHQGPISRGVRGAEAGHEALKEGEGHELCRVSRGGGAWGWAGGRRRRRGGGATRWG